MQASDSDLLFTDCPDKTRRMVIWQDIGPEGMMNPGIEGLMVVVKGKPYSIPIFYQVWHELC